MTAMPELLREEQLHEEQDLHRGLKDRHIQMIAIGGAIGVGLFLGSARAIQAAGPGLLLAYALGSIAIFFIMRALGELLLYRPVAGSFATYAEEFIGPWAGFFTGWSYWFMWVVTGMAEITAVARLRQLLVSRRAAMDPGAGHAGCSLRGESHRRGPLRRIRVLVCNHQGGDDHRADRHRPRRHPVRLQRSRPDGKLLQPVDAWRFFPKGGLGVVLSLQIVAFAFLGVELVGVTAGEAANPQKVLPQRDQQRGGADPDLLHRRPGHHHVARSLEPAGSPRRARSSWCSRRSAFRRRQGSSTSS